MKLTFSEDEMVSKVRYLLGDTNANEYPRNAIIDALKVCDHNIPNAANYLFRMKHVG